ncbi:DUF4190 domain-containing protein [Peribacillus sp. NPDC097206]|uniref:DUF4190 domain-containing protein n=1 Tax=unclassified Peribacillus TaxID=2675266 RepID=UPI00381F4294
MKKLSEIKRTNSKALASLILGILSLLIPFIGVILGIIGLIFASNGTKEIVHSGEPGINLATAGKVCSIMGIIFNMIIVLIILLFSIPS